MLRAGRTKKEMESLLQPRCHAGLTPRNIVWYRTKHVSMSALPLPENVWPFVDSRRCCSIAWVTLQPCFIFAELALPKA